MLWRGYEALRRGREERDPLELDLPERKVIAQARTARSTASSTPSGSIRTA